MTVEFTLISAGLDTGPFNLYSNLDGFVTPFEVAVSKAALLAGYSSADVPDYTSVVRIQSAGTCANWIDIILENTTTSTTTGIPTTSSTTSSTTTVTPSIPCGSASSYSGGQNYPSTEIVNLGADTGPVSLEFNAISVPDRYIVRWDGSIEIDTGYRGTLTYDFGGAQRSIFNASLTGLIDPVTSNAYPDFSTYPDDGYPRIVGTGAGIEIFIKSSSSPETATIEVYGPMAGTAWSYTMYCPNTGPTTTTTTTVEPTTSTTSTTLVPPTTTSTTTACNCDNYDLNIDTGDFVTSFGNTNPNLNNAFFVTYVDCRGDIDQRKVDSGSGLVPDFCCSLTGAVPQVTYWQNNVEFNASSYVILNGNCC